VRSGDHENDLFGFFDFIEKTPGADSIAPGFGLEVFQLLDIRPKVGMLAESWVDELAGFPGDLGLSASADSAQVFLVLLGLKDPVITQ